MIKEYIIKLDKENTYRKLLIGLTKDLETSGYIIKMAFDMLQSNNTYANMNIHTLDNNKEIFEEIDLRYDREFYPNNFRMLWKQERRITSKLIRKFHLHIIHNKEPILIINKNTEDPFANFIIRKQEHMNKDEYYNLHK